MKDNNEKVKGVLQPIVNRLGFNRSPLYIFSFSLKMFFYDHLVSQGLYALLIAVIAFVLLFFISCMLLAGFVEYFTSWYLDTFVHMKWWDYHGYFLNINGRVCLEGLLVFGLGGASITYFLAPLLNSLFNKIKYRVVIIICITLLTLFGADLVYSINHPNIGKGITDYE